MSYEIGQDYYSPDRRFRATILEVAPPDEHGGTAVRYLDAYGEEQWEYEGSFSGRLRVKTQ